MDFSKMNKIQNIEIITRITIFECLLENHPHITQKFLGTYKKLNSNL